MIKRTCIVLLCALLIVFTPYFIGTALLKYDIINNINIMATWISGIFCIIVGLAIFVIVIAAIYKSLESLQELFKWIKYG